MIADTPNVCNSLHMPAQHGASSVLGRMLRGYSSDAYMALVQRARAIIAPNTEDGIGCDPPSPLSPALLPLLGGTCPWLLSSNQITNQSKCLVFIYPFIFPSQLSLNHQ